MKSYRRLEDGTLVPAIPEPYWICSWRTFFMIKPMCCGRIFKGKTGYEEHWVKYHSVDEEFE
jgi:hypothetical protein